MTDSSSEFTLEDLADPLTFLTQNNNNPYPAYKFMRDTAPLLDPGALTGAQAADGAGSLLYATDAFPNPDTLDLTRKGKANLTSGGGPHYCLGATLSRMEAEVTPMRMLDRFSSIELTVAAEDLPRSGVVSMRGVTEFPINFELA